MTVTVDKKALEAARERVAEYLRTIDMVDTRDLTLVVITTYEAERRKGSNACLHCGGSGITILARAQELDPQGEVIDWKDRYEAERQAHKITIKAWEEERRGGPE